MLLSDSQRFIFIHNYKVAGTSIRNALSEYATPAFERLSWPMRQLTRLGLWTAPTCPNHAEAREVRDRFTDRWSDYFTFGFVRNPWSWQVSLYFFMLQNEDHWFHDDVKSMGGFEEYIEWRVQEEPIQQSSFFCDESGEYIVDFIGRLETIQADFQKVCERIGVEAELPHKNTSSHKSYHAYYNDRTRELIAEFFAEDIKRFGYSFREFHQSEIVN